VIPDTSAQDRQLGTQRRKRWPLIVAAIASLALLALAVSLTNGAGRSISSERLRFATVERGTLVRDVDVNGRVVAAVSPTVYAPAAGAVTLNVQAGATVAVGDVLARIDSPELLAELARERAGLEQATAATARQRILAERARLLADRDRDEAALTLTAAARDVERTEGACAREVLPRVDCLRLVDTLRAAEVRARHADRSHSLAREDAGFELEASEQALARQRAIVVELERRVEELAIRAPVAGRVGSVAVVDRAVVPANTPLLTVVDLTRFEVELEVPESYADALGLDMRVEVTIGDQRVAAELASIAPEVIERQVSARVRFDEQPPGLRQSQRVSARILIDEKADVLKLTRGPFLEQTGGRYAWVVEDGEAVRRPMSVGATSIGAVEITSGLIEGEQVVIAGTDLFEDAERVRLTD
jgi:HlyD family secretion protein